MKYKLKLDLELVNIKDDMYFVKDVNSDSIYLLNEIAWFILSNINFNSESDIKYLLINNLNSNEKIDKNKIEKDISNYINKLTSMQLIEKCDLEY